MNEVYVRKDNIREFIRNLYDNVYVKKSEVYTPDEWSSEGGSDSGSGSSSGGSVTPGIVYDVDQELNRNSFNPVANWVIYNALQSCLHDGDLDGYATTEQVQGIIDTAINEADLENYYTKSETYSKSEVEQRSYTKN